MCMSKEVPLSPAKLRKGRLSHLAETTSNPTQTSKTASHSGTLGLTIEAIVTSNATKYKKKGTVNISL